MNSEINLTAIYLVNIMGVTLMCLMLLGNRFEMNNEKKEAKVLKAMILTTIVSSICDTLVFQMDGHPQAIAFWIVYLGNVLQFLGNLIIGPLWIILIITHMNEKMIRKQLIFIYALCTIGVLGLIINIFEPIIFSVDSNHIYSRGPLFGMYAAIDGIFLIDSIGYYTMVKIKGGALKFFPVTQFILSLSIGLFIQGALYGVSTIWPFIAVAICGVINSLQNEKVYRDPLTGLFNRQYLNTMFSALQKKHSKIAAMMLDMNDFKSINDTYGHTTGDDALVEVGAILLDSIKNQGNVIRYAGDEFVILLNTQNKRIVENCISNIQNNIRNSNLDGKRDYQLSLSIGYSIVDISGQSLEDLLNEVDEMMYKDKERSKKRI